MKMDRVTVFHTYTAQCNSRYIEHKLQQMGHDNKHRLYHPNSTFLNTTWHHFNTSMHKAKKAYRLHITLLQWSKELIEVLCVGHVHTTYAIPDFKLRHLQMKSRKYICWRFCCNAPINVIPKVPLVLD